MYISTTKSKITMNKTKEIWIAGFALFSLFFGAGNLILPPTLGAKAGLDWWIVVLGFVLTAVTIPILAIFAHAKLQGTLYDFGKKVSPVFSTIYCFLIYIIAIAIPSPRTAAVTHEMTVQPFFNTTPLLTSVIYFVLVFIFAINRTKVIGLIGKFLTPIIVLILLIIIGIAFFSIWIQDIFNLQSGRTILTAGILLSIMILPTIITLTDDAFHHIPDKYRESAKGLGLYKFEIIKEILIPIAKPDLKAAILLAFGRALGETMAVMLVIGSIDKIPEPIYNWLSPGQTITSKLGREIAETSFGSVHFSAMIFMGLLLFILVLILTILSQNSLKSNGRLYE